MYYSKYRAKKTTVDGITFDSKREAEYYVIYKRLADTEQIYSFQRQVPIVFMLNGKKMFTYKADFTYIDSDNNYHIIDVKGVETPVFRLKKKLIEEQYGIKIEIVK